MQHQTALYAFRNRLWTVSDGLFQSKRKTDQRIAELLCEIAIALDKAPSYDIGDLDTFCGNDPIIEDIRHAVNRYWTVKLE